MAVAWNVLVVDDEEDVHNITRLALKRKQWRGRPIQLVSAKSGEEARKILSATDAPTFHCALVDVVMETNDAGLRLCDFIRSNVPRTTRLILRTGQPGVAPPEQVLNDYDIDYYLGKTEVTEERLFTTLRACFRSSQDISALVAVGAQLNSFTVALQDAATTRDHLASLMASGLRFLEDKYSAKLVFVHDTKAAAKLAEDAELSPATIAPAVATAHEKQLPTMQLLPGAELGLPAGVLLVMTSRLATVERGQAGVGEKLKRWFQTFLSEPEPNAQGVGLAVKFERELQPKMVKEFLSDLDLFVANWRLAESSLHLQDRIARERMEMLKHPGTV